MAFEAASSSPSALSLPKRYDVFISFRGEDTRSNFIGHLYKALRDKQIRTFMDDQELPKGDDISTSLLQAIEDSYTSVVVFSENYASSTWCLDELDYILYCKWHKGQIVIPVFYNVDPSHVRNQMGPYMQAFKRYESDTRFAHIVPIWREALQDAASVAGLDSSKFKFDHEMIEEIVKDILHKLNPKYQAAETIGICGIGGIGKSEVSETRFSSSRYSSRYKGSCFLENPGVQYKTVIEEEFAQEYMQRYSYGPRVPQPWYQKPDLLIRDNRDYRDEDQIWHSDEDQIW